MVIKNLIPPIDRNCRNHRNQPPKITIVTGEKNGYGKKTNQEQTERYSNKYKCPKCKNKLSIRKMSWSRGWKNYFSKEIWNKIKDQEWEVYECEKCNEIYDKEEIRCLQRNL